MTSLVNPNPSRFHGDKEFTFDEGTHKASRKVCLKAWFAARTIDKMDAVFGQENTSTLLVRSLATHKKLGYKKEAQYKSLKIEIPKD